MTRGAFDELGHWRYFFAALLLAPALLISIALDNDIWFLLNTGRYITLHGIPTIEPFTIHENFHFMAQQWLSAVAFWKVYEAAEGPGLIVLCYAVYLAFTLLFFRLCLLVSNRNHAVTFFTTLFTTSLLAFGFFVTRPQIFTLLILLAELLSLEAYIQKKNPLFLLVLPLLSILQINLHASMWPMLFVFMLPYLLDGLSLSKVSRFTDGYGIKLLLLAALIMIAAGLLNPYGSEAMTYLLRSYGHPEISKFVSEMLPPNMNTNIGKVFFGNVLSVVALLLIWRRGNMPMRFWLLMLGTGYMALSSMRSWGFFILTSGLSLASYYKGFSLPHSKRKDAVHSHLRRRLSATLCILLLCIFAQTTKEILTFEHTPNAHGALTYLSQNGTAEEMRLYLDYNEGGYSEFLGFRPYIDARAEVFVIENNGIYDVMEEYYLLQKGLLDYRTFLNRYNFTHLVVTEKDILATYLPKDMDYHMVYKDEFLTIFEANKELLE